MTWAGALTLQAFVFTGLAVTFAVYRSTHRGYTTEGWSEPAAWVATVCAGLSFIAAGFVAVVIG